MVQIRYISTSSVQPTSQALTHRIELTPCDLRTIRLDYIQKGLLFHKPKGETEQTNSLVQHLKASLSGTLNIFYPLAGRLAVTEYEDKTTCVYINCNGDGAQFVHAVADGVIVADILDPVFVPDDIVHNLFSMNRALNYEGVSKALLAVQVTELVDGIFIGCSMNHSVVDGSSFWHFFNTWSEISRTTGSDTISQTPPSFGSNQFLDGLIDLPVHLPFSYSKIMINKLVGPSSSDSLKRVVFHFSKHKVAELKAKANAEMGSDNMISSLQALMAHLWRATTRSSHLKPDDEVSYRVIVDLRPRLKPPLAEKYMGNVIQGIVVKSTAGELLKHGLGWVALQINKMIASLTAEEARKILEDWVKNPTFVPNQRDTATSASLLTGSSPRFNVYGNDFGWGRPIAVRSGTGEKMNGKLTVFSGAEQGSIDFEACLLPEILQAMLANTEFMEALLT